MSFEIMPVNVAIHKTGLNIAEYVINNNAVRDDSFSMDAQYFEKLTFVTPQIPTDMRIRG